MHSAAPARVAAAALSGATIVSTRPVGQSAALCAHARALGATCIVVPGLSLRCTDDPVAARAALRGAADAGFFIFTSAAAVRFAFELLPGLRIAPPAQALCVGAGTARALARHRVHAIYPSASSDSEGLLALPQTAALQGRRVALVCAPNGRDLLARQLRARGAQVELIHVYRRAAPRLDRRHFEALANARAPLFVLLSSAAALEHLARLIPAAVWQRLQRETLIASGARLGALAHASGFVNVVEAASALPDDLLDAAVHSLARHRL